MSSYDYSSEDWERLGIHPLDTKKCTQCGKDEFLQRCGVTSVRDGLKILCRECWEDRYRGFST